MQPATLARIAASPDRGEFCIDSHFGAGLWIRNNLLHTGDNSLDLFADFQRGLRAGLWSGTPTPDDISSVILGLVWDSLHGARKQGG